MATTQKVTAVLRKAGLTLSQRHASGMVRGWSTSTEGFQVRKWDEGVVRVDYTGGTHSRLGEGAQQLRLEEAIVVLRRAGLAVEQERTWLFVRAAALSTEEARDG